jgi:hypothetical protein
MFIYVRNITQYGLACLFWVQKVGGSNPPIPKNSNFTTFTLLLNLLFSNWVFTPLEQFEIFYLFSFFNSITITGLMLVFILFLVSKYLGDFYLVVPNR